MFVDLDDRCERDQLDAHRGEVRDDAVQVGCVADLAEQASDARLVVIEGEVVVAFVVARPGEPVDTAALDAHCLARIARFKRPKRYVFVDALPKNHYGKVLKTELRQRAAQAAHPG